MPSQVAAFPERARQLVRQLGQRIGEEVAKRERAEKKKNGDGTSKTTTDSPKRVVRVLLPSDVATMTRVSSVPEWEQLSKKLDEKVRALLVEGVDVELG
jgi:hypothetical protein